MSGATIDLERQMLGHTLAISPMAALSRVYVALCLTPPTETAGGTEASGGGYARAAATFALMASPSNAASNAASVEFLAATSAWGTIGYFELWTAATGGTRLYWGPLTDPADGVPIEIDVAAGDVVRFSAGTLIVQAADTLSGGPFLPLSGGEMTGPLIYTATGGNTPRAGQDRAADVVNVKDFGAIGDGVANDTTAINAALNHVRATGTYDHQTVTLAFPAGRYVVTGPLNFTGIANNYTPVVIEGHGSELWLKGAAAVVDCYSSRWLTFKDLAIFGDPATPPRIGIQLGRIATQQGDFITFINCKVHGSFTFTGLYNWASETMSAYACTFNNGISASGAYCAVMDGINHWGVTSTFVTVGFPADATQSNNSATFSECTFQGNGPSGNVWMANCAGHVYRGCYASNVSGSIFVLYAFSTAGFPAGLMLELDCHCETTALQYMLYVAAAPGVTYAAIIGLLMRDYACQASVAAIGSDAALSVEIREARLHLMGPCAKLCDAPSRYIVRAHEAFLNDPMTTTLPASFYGPVSKETTPDNYTKLMGGLVATGDLNTSTNVVGNFLISTGGFGIIGSGSASGSNLNMLSASGGFRGFTFGSAISGAGVRWQVGSDANPESGGNAGGNFQWLAFSDTGTLLGSYLTINRASAQAQFAGGIRANGIGLWGSTVPAAKPAVTGSRGGNAAVASLLTALAAYGLITDSSTA